MYQVSLKRKRSEVAEANLSKKYILGIKLKERIAKFRISALYNPIYRVSLKRKNFEVSGANLPK